MKKSLFFLLLSACCFVACNDDWDDYYSDNGSVIRGVDTTSTVMDCTIQEFFQQMPEYKEFYSLLKGVGATADFASDQELTVWVVPQEAIDRAAAEDKYSEENTLAMDTLRLKYHVNYLSINRSQLKDGARLKTLNNIYIAISVRDTAIFANESRIVTTYRLNNGVVHVLDEMMTARQNLYDYIANLDDSYSIFRDSIMAKSELRFNASKSVPVGVNEQGNTIYQDSVMDVYNPLFEVAQFNSEFLQYTCFLPNDEVIKACFDKFNETNVGLGRGELTLNDTIFAMDWLIKASIYEGTLDSTAARANDIYSAFGNQWKNYTTPRDGSESVPVQVIDTENTQELSNGRVYPVESVKIPNNVIITRLKQYVYHYMNLTEDQKKLFFCFKGMSDVAKVSCDPKSILPDAVKNTKPKEYYTTNGEWHPAWAEFPFTEFMTSADANGAMCYTFMTVNADKDARESSISFTPMTPIDWGVGNVKEYKIPAGEYELYLGFRAAASGYLTISFATAETDEEGNPVVNPDDPDGDVMLVGGKYDVIARELNISLATPYNYDRVGSDGGNSGMAEYSSGKNVWNGNGARIGVVNVKGEGMQSVRIKMTYVQGDTKYQPYHWCLKPTADNY